MPQEPLLVVVPEPMGQDALAGVDGVRTVLVGPDEPVPEAARTAQVLVVGPAEASAEVDAALAQVSELPQLHLMITLGRGTNPWDGRLPEGLELATARGAHGGSTAEWVVAALLAVVRELPEVLSDQRDRRWRPRTTGTLMGTRALVLGAGDLGANVRDRLAPFGVDVVVAARTTDASGLVDAGLLGGAARRRRRRQRRPRPTRRHGRAARRAGVGQAAGGPGRRRP